MPDVSGLPDADTVPHLQGHETTPGGAAFNGDTVKFSSEAPTSHAEVPPSIDPTVLSASPDTALLQNFLRRPVNIHTIGWTEAFTSVHIDPWAKLLNTPSIIDKVSNYR
eukprot:341036_1